MPEGHNVSTRRTGGWSSRRRAVAGSGVAVALMAGLLSYPTAVSSATLVPLTVTATASPPSGRTVVPGSTVTYTLKVVGNEPLPGGATVVDDLSGALGHAHVSTPAGDLTRQG